MSGSQRWESAVGPEAIRLWQRFTRLGRTGTLVVAAAIAVVVMAVLAGCGGEDGDDTRAAIAAAWNFDHLSADERDDNIDMWMRVCDGDKESVMAAGMAYTFSAEQQAATIAILSAACPERLLDVT